MYIHIIYISIILSISRNFILVLQFLIVWGLKNMFLEDIFKKNQCLLNLIFFLRGEVFSLFSDTQKDRK